MLCSSGIELIKQLERTSDDTLPPYSVSSLSVLQE